MNSLCSRLDGRPGGNRTPNLRFWRPPLCQLSYWPTLFGRNRWKRFRQNQLNTPIMRRAEKRGFRPPGKPVRLAALFLLFEYLRHDAGADGLAALADRKAQPLVHRDRADQLDRHLDVVP